jgi:hypothetical protein
MLNEEPRKISVERRFEPIINSVKPVKLTLDQAGRSNYQQDSTSIYIAIDHMGRASICRLLSL